MTREEVLQVADMCKLSLSEEEINIFMGMFTGVMEQVKELDELEENELMGLTAQRLVRYLEEELPGRIEEINL